MDESTAIPRLNFGAADPIESLRDKLRDLSPTPGAADPYRDQPGPSPKSATLSASATPSPSLSPSASPLPSPSASPLPSPSASPSPSTEPRIIRVNVRKGAHGEQRVVSFNRQGIAASELMRNGIAIDGTHATFAVTGVQKSADGEHFLWFYEGPFIENARAQSLPEALLLAEQGLIAFLEERGLKIEFA